MHVPEGDTRRGSSKLNVRGIENKRGKGLGDYTLIVRHMVRELVISC